MTWGRRATHLTDEALLAAVALGEQDAFAVLVRRFQRKVYGLALLMLRDQTAAEDVAQQTFERAWRHAATFDARRGSVSTWLLAVTRNSCLDALRLRRPELISPDDLAELLPPSGERQPEAAAEMDDDLARLRIQLRALPVEQQRAVVLSVMLGCSASEISEHELIPLGTAKTRLRAGMMRLRTALVESRSGDGSTENDHE